MRLVAFLALLTGLCHADDITPADWSDTVYFWPEQAQGWGQGGKDKPVVPEPANYGFVALGGAMAWCLVRRPHR